MCRANISRWAIVKVTYPIDHPPTGCMKSLPRIKLPSIRNRAAPGWLSRIVMVLALALILAFLMRWLVPVYRIGARSELLMLGDFNNDKKWDKADLAQFKVILANPFRHSAKDCIKADLNSNGELDPEDLQILELLAEVHDPYEAEIRAVDRDEPFPRPRELYRFVSPQDYINRPLVAVPYEGAEQSPLSCLHHAQATTSDSPYERELSGEIYSEAVRFDLAYQARKAHLTPLEQTYVKDKIDACNVLHEAGLKFDLLLELMSLVEDAETLTTAGQDEFVARMLYLRDDLRELLISKSYKRLQEGQVPASEIIHRIEGLLAKHLDQPVKLETLGPPRDLTKLDNYVSRTRWQYHKTSARVEQFEQLIRFAQHDRRYLRAVSQTTPKHTDTGVENHNLPMVLLFREALRITGDKKSAVGLIDETIRIPFFWVKSIPRERLPDSVAQVNFLLPGNKEDGSDKSRHWNVFGGICLYKSPQESLDLALKREMKDLREGRYSPEAMTEFIRDTIANLQGIYYVVNMNPDLLGSTASSSK